jgi:hypothetical protein
MYNYIYGVLNWKDELKKYPLLVDQTDTIKKFKDRFATCFSLQGQIKSFYLKEISPVDKLVWFRCVWPA